MKNLYASAKRLAQKIMKKSDLIIFVKPDNCVEVKHGWTGAYQYFPSYKAFIDAFQ